MTNTTAPRAMGTKPAGAKLMRSLLEIVRMCPPTFGDAIMQVAALELARTVVTPAQWRRLRLAATGIVGLRDRRRARSTGVEVSVYGPEAGIEDGPESDFTVVCEEHSYLVCFPTLHAARAFIPCPESFCDGCRAVIEEHRTAKVGRGIARLRGAS